MALDKGFGISTMYGQEEPKLMPMSDSETINNFAQAIYELGVQSERERCADMCISWGNARVDEYGGHALRNCAEAIRKG